MGGAEKVEIEHGNHSLSNRVQEAVQAIVDFVKRDGPQGWDDPWNWSGVFSQFFFPSFFYLLPLYSLCLSYFFLCSHSFPVSIYAQL